MDGGGTRRPCAHESLLRHEHARGRGAGACARGGPRRAPERAGRAGRRRARDHAAVRSSKPRMSAWTEVAPGVRVRTSRCYAMNTLVAEAQGHALVVDPGVLPSELDELAGVH